MAPLQDLQFPSRGDDDDRDTGRKSIFMNQKSMAGTDVFARLAAITAAAPDPDGENIRDGDEDVVVSPLRSSRIRTHSHGYGDSGYVTPSLGGSGMSSGMTSSVPPSSPGSPGKPRKRRRMDAGDR
jgi:hypothetical protein